MPWAISMASMRGAGEDGRADGVVWHGPPDVHAFARDVIAGRVLRKSETLARLGLGLLAGLARLSF